MTNLLNKIETTAPGEVTVSEDPGYIGKYTYVRVFRLAEDGTVIDGDGMPVGRGLTHARTDAGALTATLDTLEHVIRSAHYRERRMANRG